MTSELAARPPAATPAKLVTPRFVALALASLAYFTADGVLIPAVPRYVEGPLASGNVAVGLVVGAFSLSAFFLRPLAGGIGDRRGRRPLMLIGAGLFAVSVLGYGLTASPATLGALRLLTGAGEAFFFVGMATAFTDLAPPERRGEAMSLASLALYVGIGLGPLLGEAAIAWSGFPAAWAVATVAAVIALATTLLVPETRPTQPEPAGDPAPRRLVHPAGLLPGLVLLASIFGMAGFLTFVPLYARDLGMSGSHLVLLTFSGVVVAIRSAGARIPDRLGPARATRAALTLSAIGLGIAGVWRTPAGLLTGTVVFGAGVALLTPAVMTLAVQGVAARERGAVMGTTTAFLDIALGLGPASLGFVAAGFGRPGTFLAGAGVAVAGLALVAVTRLGKPAPAARPAVPSDGAAVPQAAPAGGAVEYALQPSAD